MLLCIDIGNTNLVFGLWKENRWIDRWRVRTVQNKMADEYAMLLKTLLAEGGYDFGSISRISIASVVPRLRSVFYELFLRYLEIEPLILGPGVRTGLKIRIDNPVELGADLVADAVAAYSRFEAACIIVDFGTATTFSAVSSKGEFMGVSIAPGIEVAADALSSTAAQLPRISLVPPPAAIGTNTIHSMQSGLIFGYTGLVEGLIRHIKEELGGEASVIATGGLSRVVAPLTGMIDVTDPDLTLEGLRLIAERNSR
ncbi:MAG: type III pantothenate kinase [Spirochaetes bacterium]|nr:type III pantothenate kinase [Spirochaetota bacterium]